MKHHFLTLFISLLSITVFGQQLTSKEWNEESKTNIRLLPKYGLITKTEAQKQSDELFITETMKQEQFKGDQSAASGHLIELGFKYLYRGDIKTAMYRFNQAYLLDSLNTDIYWGYGAVYMTIGEYDKAKNQYQEGLSKNPKNPHLLTDLGTYYMAQYNILNSMNEKNANQNLDLAIANLTRSYQLDSKDQNTSFKLSICYFLQGDCEDAWRYYNECKAQGGRPITDDYTSDLARRCKK